MVKSINQSDKAAKRHFDFIYLSIFIWENHFPLTMWPDAWQISEDIVCHGQGNSAALVMQKYK